jgi:fucose 4-O-acetylase-like acetyltransferase
MLCWWFTRTVELPQWSAYRKKINGNFLIVNFVTACTSVLINRYFPWFYLKHLGEFDIKVLQCNADFKNVFMIFVSHLSSARFLLDSWPVTTSVRNCHYTLRNSPVERNSLSSILFVCCVLQATEFPFLGSVFGRGWTVNPTPYFWLAKLSCQQDLLRSVFNLCHRAVVSTHSEE